MCFKYETVFMVEMHVCTLLGRCRDVYVVLGKDIWFTSLWVWIVSIKKTVFTNEDS